MDKNTQPIIVIVGGQYGSESKGTVVGHLARERGVDIAVRTGSVNAGHTVYYEGKPYKMQQIPCAWVNPQTVLVIGAGAYIAPEILEREVKVIADATHVTPGEVKKRILIDRRAGLHLPVHHDAERESKLHERMGSTGEGCMEAIIDKMRRDNISIPFSESAYGRGWECIDTVSYLHQAYDEGMLILLEGTQGTLLDLHLGYYPYVTSRQTTAAAWIAEAGLSPGMEYEIIQVIRTYPIRVAGNSGPMPNEISWPQLARRINVRLEAEGNLPLVEEWALLSFENACHLVAQEMNLPEPVEKISAEGRIIMSERLSRFHQKALSLCSHDVQTELAKLFEMTTVTRKLRRIGELDTAELQFVSKINRPDSLVITFLNYVFPELRGETSWEGIDARPGSDAYRTYLKGIQEAVGVPIRYVNTGPEGLVSIPGDALGE